MVIICRMQWRRKELNATELGHEHLTGVWNEVELGGDAIHAERNCAKEHLVQESTVQLRRAPMLRQSALFRPTTYEIMRDVSEICK